MATTIAPPTATATIAVRFTDGRIGRYRDINPLVLTVNLDHPRLADLIAQAVHEYARQFLMSTDYLVTVSLATGTGSIEAGRFATFAFPAVTR